MLSSILKETGFSTGVIGTTGYFYGGKSEELLNTTPDPLIIQGILAEMSAEGVTHVVMEVSSHGLVQKRTHTIPFSRALFTNLTQDHLDYHGNMDEYARAKGILFDEAVIAGRPGFQALGSFDDSYTASVIRNIPSLTFGLGDGADYRATDISCTAEGSDFVLVSPEGKINIHLNLIGLFNVRNAMAAASTALSMGISHEDLQKGLENISSVPGRLEGIRSDSGFAVIIDYAHTPDALSNVLAALKPLAEGRLITVYGCGGDRDAAKRPLMSGAVAEYSDFAVLTNDNPRSEDPAAIAAQAEQGFADADLQEERYRVILDRKEAIKFAINSAKAGDIVLVAGKGHENYQEIQRIRHPFDDRSVSRGILKDNGHRVY
jgi:UDP-N-acetylmuramoyl-L-alanyl-D-glutamate--2,6-diaminopimelate ligase